MSLIHIHLVSDSTGETVNSVSRAAMARFDDLEAREHIWPLVRSKAQMEKVIAAIRENHGLVLFTIIDEEISNMLRFACRELNIPCIPIIARVVTEISNYMKIDPTTKMGQQHQLDEEYFSRVEAINFALNHDDGQSHWNLEDADIVVVGASRTSKSPTCMYLAYRGFKAANVPYVMGCPLPESLYNLKTPFCVGLAISPDRLVAIRKSRLASLDQKEETSYVNVEQVIEEINESRKFFNQMRWPVIDVTRRSVEETAASIIQMYQEYKEK